MILWMFGLVVKGSTDGLLTADATSGDFRRELVWKSHLQRFRPQEIRPKFLAHPKLAARFFALRGDVWLAFTQFQ